MITPLQAGYHLTQLGYPKEEVPEVLVSFGELQMLIHEMFTFDKPEKKEK